MFKIAVLGGDGIGPEVTREAVEVLRLICRICKRDVEFIEGAVGGDAIDRTGKPLPDETMELVKKSEAVLLGAVGGPKWDNLDFSIRPERALLGLRKGLGLFANLRPAKLFTPLVNASTLKRGVIEGTDIIVVRELTGDVYFGEPRGVFIMPDGSKKGVNTMVYTTDEIRRIAEVAFRVARGRRKKVTSVDKANVLESTELWRRTVSEVHSDYPDVELDHMYVDNCAMQLIRNPRKFDIILTTNLFGDILSDEAAMLTGSIGMLPSASLGGRTSLYEPVHGSAPDIAGMDIANPIGSILSAAMLLEYSMGLPAYARLIESAVERVLEKGYRTRDIWEDGCILVGTKQMGRLIREEIERIVCLD